MRTVIVKLKNAVPPKRGLARIRALVGSKDLAAVQQLFPGDREPETASILELRVHDSVAIDEVLAKIRDAGEVEYAHVPSERKPV
jgi:hypothetical protein